MDKNVTRVWRETLSVAHAKLKVENTFRKILRQISPFPIHKVWLGKIETMGNHSNNNKPSSALPRLTQSS